jgi:hypothetical protein
MIQQNGRALLSLRPDFPPAFLARGAALWIGGTNNGNVLVFKIGT